MGYKLRIFLALIYIFVGFVVFFKITHAKADNYPELRRMSCSILEESLVHLYRTKGVKAVPKNIVKQYIDNCYTPTYYDAVKPLPVIRERS